MRTRGFLAHPLLAILVLLALVGGLALPLDASPAQAAEPGRSLGPPGLGEGHLAPAALASAGDGPGHHFGFGQASVLAQVTPTSTSTPTPTGTPPTATPTTVPAQQVPCASVAGQTCTVTGTGSGTTGSVTGTGTVQSNGGMAWSLTASVPAGFPGAPVIPAGTVPVATFTTTLGTETITCTAVTTIPGATQTTCTGNTVGLALQGSTVTVTYQPGATATGSVSGPGPAAVGTGNPPASSGQTGTPCTGQIGGTCTVTGAVTGTWTKVSSGTFTFTATGPANTTPGGVPRVFIPTTAGVESFACSTLPVTAPFTATCTGTTVGDLLQGAVVTVRFPLVGGATADVTGTATGLGATSLTIQQALALVQPSGQLAVPCALLPGDVCQVAGGVSGQGRVTASMVWTLTATVPAGTPAGLVPVAVFSTTAGLEGIACAAVVAGTATVTCAGTTVGNALQGSLVTVVFGGGIAPVVGTVTGPGAPPLGLALPLLPPPLGLGPLAPPPPPLLPPPPSVAGSSAFARPVASYGEVPVVPEADSVALLLGGLLTLGVVAGWRARRER